MLASGDGRPLTAKKGPFVEEVHIGPQGVGVQQAAETESRFKHWTQAMSSSDHSLQMHHLNMEFEGDSRVGQKPFSSIRIFDTAMRIFPLQYLFPD
jgi:hypothetical protein